MKSPMIVRADGSIEDRASGTPIGRVWLKQGTGDDAGWFASCPAHHDHGAHWTRVSAARGAWWCGWGRRSSASRNAELREAAT